MIRKELVKNITDLRTDPISLFMLARRKGSPLYVFNRTEPLGVLLSWEDFESLTDRLEDDFDRRELQAARASSAKLIPWNEAKQEIDL